MSCSRIFQEVCFSLIHHMLTLKQSIHQKQHFVNLEFLHSSFIQRTFLPIDNYILLLQLYTVSRDGALCVWQCDTELSGLIPRTPKSHPTDQEESAKDLEEELIETQRDKEIHGKASGNEKQHKKKVKYSCAAK